MKTLFAFLIPLALCAGTVTAAHHAFAEDTADRYVVNATEPVGKPIVLAQADTGSAPVAIDAGTTAAPAPAPSATASPAPKLPDPPSIDQVTKLWRGGGFLVAGIVTLYLLLTLAMKLDKRHAFYIAAGLASVGVLVDAINRGETPTLGMMIAALGTLLSILLKGPDKKAPSSS